MSGILSDELKNKYAEEIATVENAVDVIHTSSSTSEQQEAMDKLREVIGAGYKTEEGDKDAS